MEFANVRWQNYLIASEMHDSRTRILRRAMAVSKIESTGDIAKEVFATDYPSEESSVNEKSQTTWQVVLQDKTAVF